MMFKKVTEVKPTKVLRVPTCIPELDWLYGFTGSTWGIPIGKMSLWAGEKGTGKSRAAIEVCRTVARKVWSPVGGKPYSYKVLYFQREVDLGTLAGWVKQDGGVMPDNFYVSRSCTVAEQCSEIRQLRPRIVVVDSINMVKDFRGNSEEKIEIAIEGGNGQDCYRAACEAVGCHIIFLNQLNKDGSAKGSSCIAHLLDVEMILKRNGPDGFSIACPQKNRYGKTGLSTWWVHNAKKAYAESSFRLEDADWCRTHGLKRRDIAAEGEVFRKQIVEESYKEYDAEVEQLEIDRHNDWYDGLSTGKKFGRWFFGMSGKL